MKNGSKVNAVAVASLALVVAVVASACGGTMGEPTGSTQQAIVCTQDVCPPENLLAEFRATQADIDQNIAAVLSEAPSALTGDAMDPINALAQDVHETDVHGAQLPGPNQEALDQKLQRLSDEYDAALVEVQSALDVVAAQIQAAAQSQQVDRWKTLEDVQTKLQAIQTDASVNKAKTQDKMFNKWDEYVRG